MNLSFYYLDHVSPPPVLHFILEGLPQPASPAQCKYWPSKGVYRRRRWHPTTVLLPGKCHRQRSLVGSRPWDQEESDTTEQPHFHFSLSCIGEGNGNPFQCSCLENPRDRGPCWAVVYGVAQSQTQLMWFSSSSSSRDLFKKIRDTKGTFHAGRAQ